MSDAELPQLEAELEAWLQAAWTAIVRAACEADAQEAMFHVERREGL
jgi:hypothetical protein